jgi:hypothetical protein
MRGRVITQAVSRWFPTAAARVRARVWSCGICGEQSGAGAGFLRVLRFPLPISIPPIASQSPSSIVWGLYNRPEMAAVPRDFVPPHNKKRHMGSGCIYPHFLDHGSSWKRVVSFTPRQLYPQGKSIGTILPLYILTSV